MSTPATSQASATAPRAASPAYETVYRFRGRTVDGSHPFGGLVDMDGVLYGATDFGGVGRAGTIFSVTAAGAEHVLYSFKKAPDGAFPRAGLTNVSGTLYGTTAEGGDRRGTIFSVSTGGAEKIVYDFPIDNTRGNNPEASLLDKNGFLYGTTVSGGAHSEGTVFALKPGTSAAESVLYSFGPAPDGSRPAAPVIDVDGTLYGTTLYGGAYGECYSSCGTVFSLTKSGVEKVLHSFGGGNDGHTPIAGLVDVDGILYGTTSSGGTDNNGIVFSITTSGTEKVIYNFTGGTDGGSPVAGLTIVGGVLYGTTSGGGNATCSCGTIFSISTSGSLKTLHAFTGGSDGSGPHAKLLDVKGVLYGTTTYGGDEKCGASSGCGTIFALHL